jgi:hypothetical protein
MASVMTVTMTIMWATVTFKVCLVDRGALRSIMVSVLAAWARARARGRWLLSLPRPGGGVTDRSVKTAQ